MILDYAKSNGIPVPFKSGTGNGDLLSTVIASGSDARVEFVLDKLAEKCGSVEETGDLLESFSPDLWSYYFEIIDGFVTTDKCTMEYARFEAPKAVFGRNGRTPIVMCMDHHLEDWTMDSSAAKELWIRNSEHGERLSDTTSEQIKVVAKHYCVVFEALWHTLGSQYVL